MTDLVNPKAVSIRSTDFTSLINPNGAKKYRYIGIVYNMLEFPSKYIFSANWVCASVHFYEYKLQKLGGKQRMFTTYSREICMFISDGIAYLPVICLTNEEMD